MAPAPRPDNELQRLKALEEFEILDTLPEQAYDDITLIAAQICDVPVALMSLVDEDRQWFKSRVGFDLTETPREHAFCAHAILEPDQLTVIEDARADVRFADSPLVTGATGVRFYAGAPLVTRAGHALGTLCVIDRKPRRLTAAQQESLRALSRQVIAQLELRRLVTQLEHSRDELAALCDVLERQAEATDRDLQRAEIIQRSLLPPAPPALPHCCVQSLYQPGRSVGGDLFDVMPLGERFLMLVIADAAGHGLSAAMLSVLFKHRLDYLDETGQPARPASVLARANAAMRTSPVPPGMFVTALVARLDLERRELLVASAGHTPLLWLRADNTQEQVRQTGPALGLFDIVEYGEQTLSLAEGDRVLFFTDGVLELDPSESTQVQALGERLIRIGRRPDALRVLFDELAGAVEREDRDDVTLLLLDAAPGESRFLERAALSGQALSPVDPPRIRFGEKPGMTFIALEGRVTWLYAQALFESALAVLEGHRTLVLDLGACEHLDSTVLGTLHELVLRARLERTRVVFQRVPERLVAAFRELSMTTVLDAIGEVSEPLPAELADLDLPVGDLRRHRQRLLRAHQALAELSQHNREAFADLLGTLRNT